MATVRHLVSNFTAGEFSPRLYGRPDIAKYRNAVRSLENMTVVPHGGARKRPGFNFVIEAKDSDEPVRLVPFQYNVEQTYMLVFGQDYIWFCKDRGIITHATTNISAATKADPCVVTSASHGLTDGQWVYITGVSGMHQINNRRFQVAGATATTFQLSGVDSSAYGTYGSGGTVGRIVELPVVYTEDELEELQFAQSTDTLYIAHPDHPLQKLTRTSHTAWTLSEVDIVKGPFRTINPNSTLTLTPSSFSGAATAYGTQQVGRTFTLTASTPVFNSGHIGALFRLSESSNGETGIAAAPVGSTSTLANADVYTTEGKVYGVANLTGAAAWTLFTAVPKHDAGRVRIYGGSGTGVFFDSDYLHDATCVIQITAYTSTTVVTAEIVWNQMPASIIAGGTAFWEEGAFSTYRGFARAITFFEQRLMLASTNSDPATVWGSRSGAFEDFQDGPDDDDAISFTLATGQIDYIRWIYGGRLLTCGTAGGEFAIAGTTSNEALTPTNVRAIPQTSFGSSSCLPVRAGQIVLFAQRSGDPDNAGRKLREMAYQYEQDAFNAADLTVFSEHITGTGIAQLAYQVDPDSIVWGRKSVGTLCAVTYEREQQVVAWHTHQTGQSEDGNDEFTKVLLHFNGDDAATTIADGNAGGSAHTWTASGNAQIDTAESHFGDASLGLDGTGDYVSTPDHADFTLDTSDFTIDCWFNCTAAAGDYAAIASQSDAAFTDYTWAIYRNDANVIGFDVTADGSTIQTLLGTTTFSDALNTGWHHVAVTRSGNTFRLFIDGALEDSDTFAITVHNGTDILAVGAFGASADSRWTGWIDEFRLSVGIARWTEDFTPPTSPYTAAAVVENIASLPGADADELWIEVARAINGGIKRYIEVSAPAMRDDTAKEDGIFLDSSLTYEGAATSTIGSLWHLEGQTVDVLNYGSVERSKTVSNGAITLTTAATANQPVHVGLGYTAVLETLDLEAGAQAGTAQSRKGKLGDVFIRLHRSLGGTVVGVHEDDILYRTPEDFMGASPPLFSGLKKVEFPGGWTNDEGSEDATEQNEKPGRILRLEHDDPLPFFVTGIVAEVTTSG